MYNFISKLNLKELINNPDIVWHSYFIDWVEPKEIRYWTQLENGLRICLQKFYPCDNKNKLYYHSHPWPKHVMICKGSIKHGISTTYDVLDYHKTSDINNVSISSKLKQTELVSLIHGTNSFFTIDNPNCWHLVEPLNNEPVYCIMITEKPWFKGPKAPSKEIKTISNIERLDLINTILEWEKHLQ